MANDLAEFDKKAAEFKKKVELAVVILTRNLAEALFNAFVARTPVRTGRARGSWRMSVNERNRTMLPEAPEGTTYPPPKPPSIRVRVGDVVYVSNEIPYMEALEQGSSVQAPNGFFALSVEEIKAKLPEFERAALKEAGI